MAYARFLLDEVEIIRTVRSEVKKKLELADRHLGRVQEAALDPVDWAPLSTFGLHALEAAVDAAALLLDLNVEPRHWVRQETAELLATDHGLPPVANLLRDLNETRKAEAYGDVTAPPTLDADEVAIEIEAFLHSVSDLAEARE